MVVHVGVDEKNGWSSPNDSLLRAVLVGERELPLTARPRLLVDNLLKGDVVEDGVLGGGVE